MFDYPDGCLFDLDGTLVHNEHDFFYPEFCQIYDQLGVKPPERPEFDKMISDHNLFADIESSERKEFSSEFWKKFDKVPFPLARALPGSIETLEHFVSVGSRIAVITARTHLPEDVEHCLQHTGLLDHICVVSTLGEPHLFTTESHPHLKREQILDVCTRLEIEPTRCAVFGDAPTDITSGKAVNAMATIALLSGGIGRHILERVEPDLILDNIFECISFFSGS